MKKYFYLFESAFLGHRYHGWQKQTDGFKTVQQQIDRQLKYLLEENKFKTLPASRTDKMVSARKHYFQLYAEQPVDQNLPDKLNKFLPDDIEILKMTEVSEDFQIIGGDEFETPLSEQAKGWLETAQIDTLGHQLEARLARQIPEELERLSERVLGLFNSGWESVKIVTDHGWLFLPGGLPKVDLPKHLTESRWARCAVISGESDPDVMKHPWYWNKSRFFATPPGCACFNKSPEYAHGGLSLQECLIPELLVEYSGDVRVKASIESISWKGLRCIVEARADGTGIQADLRLKHPGGISVVSNIKPLSDQNRVSLLLEDDEHLATELILVLLDSEGNILAYKSTQVGSHS